MLSSMKIVIHEWITSTTCNFESPVRSCRHKKSFNKVYLITKCLKLSIQFSNFKRTFEFNKKKKITYEGVLNFSHSQLYFGAIILIEKMRIWVNLKINHFCFSSQKEGFSVQVFLCDCGAAAVDQQIFLTYMHKDAHPLLTAIEQVQLQ